MPTAPASAKQLPTVLTQELALAIDSAFERRYSERPYLVLCHLARQKLDVNRPLPEATCGNPQAAAAWTAYHAFLDSAAAVITRPPGQRGLLLDLQATSTRQRIELGYLMRSKELRLPDRRLPALADSTSIWGLVAVPSLPDPAPATGAFYFGGGYNVLRHGSRDLAGPLDAVQTETNYAGEYLRTYYHWQPPRP